MVDSEHDQLIRMQTRWNMLKDYVMGLYSDDAESIIEYMDILEDEPEEEEEEE